MARKQDRIQALAAKGVRDEMTEMLEKIVEYKQLLPSISPLAQVQAALSATIEHIDGGPPRKRVLRVEIPERVVRRITNGARPHKPKAKLDRTAAVKAMSAVARKRSWAAGREVLVALSDHDGGLTITELAKELKMPETAIYHRVKTRAKHGHVKLLDAAKRLWGITPDGRNALRNDRDSEL